MDRTEAFRVLASADRQLVLHELLERDDEATIRKLSRQVAARRHRIPPPKIDETAVDRARIRLIHSHFPYLSDVGLIDVEWDERKVVLADKERVDQLLEAAELLDTWPPTDLLDHPS
ncbi:DUF7344 domain-containing protein [Natronobacterium texcoconense]|uniref:DUF7344 domain-containing protein n=1 Tax=Natronobacterium texcoconense TaxID=1095778 RepID=A0A1H0ZAH6_NATTX|nr:hypothetical protein [Natronobacterium texcoconense]SDQ24408.1 hypothetical protein SAMN04489842_0201 [Natronobacterium texcoconense]